MHKNYVYNLISSFGNIHPGQNVKTVEFEQQRKTNESQRKGTLIKAILGYVRLTLLMLFSDKVYEVVVWLITVFITRRSDPYGFIMKHVFYIGSCKAL